MRKIAFTLTLFFFAVNLFGQSDEKKMIGATITIGSGYLHTLPGTIGGAIYNLRYNVGCGVIYTRPTSKNWDFGTGLEFSYNYMIQTHSTTYGPNFCGSVAHLYMVSVPAHFTRHFGDIFFFNGSIFVNVLSRINRQETIIPVQPVWEPPLPPIVNEDQYNVKLFLGLGGGIGVEQEFGNGVVLSLYPYVRFDGFIENLMRTHVGVSLGVGYRF
ncbi:MAG: hypothetical protein LBC84_01530 [Prevotellaceae bacterium]|jgi:hypothetical protein|nr:hypothetical protein [Prevotellaceae bacterium]